MAHVSALTKSPIPFRGELQNGLFAVTLAPGKNAPCKTAVERQQPAFAGARVRHMHPGPCSRNRGDQLRGDFADRDRPPNAGPKFNARGTSFPVASACT